MNSLATQKLSAERALHHNPMFGLLSIASDGNPSVAIRADGASPPFGDLQGEGVPFGAPSLVVLLAPATREGFPVASVNGALWIALGPVSAVANLAHLARDDW